MPNANRKPYFQYVYNLFKWQFKIGIFKLCQPLFSLESIDIIETLLRFGFEFEYLSEKWFNNVKI